MKRIGPIASIHSHFNIFRDVHEKGDGPITHEEQVKAVQRFIRWHERQVEVGKRLLANIEAYPLVPAAAQVPVLLEPATEAVNQIPM